jgi:beta-mannosidase
MQEEFVLQRVGNPESLNEMVEKSQEYQALQLKYHTEFYRRYKFNPCNGALQFIFNDCWPAISWSVVDYYRKKKKGYYALKQAFNPIYIMMDWPNLEGEKEGSTFSKRVYIVNDYQHEYKSLSVKWLILDSTNNLFESKELSCSVPENSVIAVDDIQWEIPKGENSYRIRLELSDSNELKSSNDYIFKVVS